MGPHCARTAMWSAVSPSAFCALTQRALHASAAEPSAAASSSRTAPAHWRSVAACSGVLPSASAAKTSAPHTHSARTHAPFAAKCSAPRPVLSRALFTAARCAGSASSASSAALSPPIAAPSSGDSTTGCRTSSRRCCCTSTPVAVAVPRLPDIALSRARTRSVSRSRKGKKKKTARRLGEKKKQIFVNGSSSGRDFREKKEKERKKKGEPIRPSWSRRRRLDAPGRR